MANYYACQGHRIFNKIVDILKEVFWLKQSSPKKRKPARRKSTVKKKAVKKIVPKAKKPAIKPTVKLTAKLVKVPKKISKPALDPSLVPVGEITHYFERIKVCVVKVTRGTILIGDKLTVAVKGGHFVQKVWSMQIESRDVKIAKKGQLIGLKIDKPVAVGDIVYK